MGFLSFPTLTRLKLFSFEIWLKVDDGTTPVDCDSDGCYTTGVFSFSVGFECS